VSETCQPTFEEPLILFSNMTVSLHLALLICDTPAPKVVEKYGAYDKLFRTVFEKARPADVEIAWSDFDVVTRQEYPPIEDFKTKKYNGIVITGSARGAYEDEEWIHKLIDYVKQVREKAPETRIVGICFGHQIIAIASGGACVPNPSGWEVRHIV
jgi:GMP synthase-like glutamine amidotransferase